MPPKKKVAGDPGKGEKIFKNLCAVCHSFAAHGTGPNLQGTVGAAVVHEDVFIVIATLQFRRKNVPDNLIDLLNGQGLVIDTRYH